MTYNEGVCTFGRLEGIEVTTSTRTSSDRHVEGDRHTKTVKSGSRNTSGFDFDLLDDPARRGYGGLPLSPRWITIRDQNDQGSKKSLP